jgi:predicted O-methyltransferase YrrM
MRQDLWSTVDGYIVEKLVPPDPVLTDVLANNDAAGLPAHDVSPAQGRFLHLLARMIGARRVLEIGTLGAYSTIWFARALPEGGRVVTLEFDPCHAEVARSNIACAGLAGVIDLRVGAALDTLPAVYAEGLGPFDLIFIDADKENNPAYLAWALRLARPGTVIIGDNVVRDGTVADAGSADARVQGVRAFFDMLAATPGLSATALQTVGSKGWDGFAIALVG